MGLIYHQVNTYIEDDDFDMVSQEILLNGSLISGVTGFIQLMKISLQPESSPKWSPY